MKYTEQAVETLDDAGSVIANKNIEIEQLRQRVQELEFALAETEALEISHGERIEKLIQAIKNLYFGYVRLIENGRDRIMMLGGDCDSLQYMEENDPLLIETRKIFK